jgi:hypothetical protein
MRFASIRINPWGTPIHCATARVTHRGTLHAQAVAVARMRANLPPLR